MRELIGLAVAFSGFMLFYVLIGVMIYYQGKKADKKDIDDLKKTRNNLLKTLDTYKPRERIPEVFNDDDPVEEMYVLGKDFTKEEPISTLTRIIGRGRRSNYFICRRCKHRFTEVCQTFISQSAKCPGDFIEGEPIFEKEITKPKEATR